MSLKEWLASYGCEALSEASITIGRTTYDAVFFRHKSPEVEAVMVVGELPSAYRRSSKTCFRLAGDKRDWYVASHTTVEVANDPRFAEFHYNGVATFQLRPWDAKGAIDEYEERPYRRVEAKVLVAV